METNLNIDPSLLEEACSLSGLKTRRETVNLALDEFMKRRKQKEIIELFDTVEYEPGYNYKKERSRINL